MMFNSVDTLVEFSSKPVPLFSKEGVGEIWQNRQRSEEIMI